MASKGASSGWDPCIGGVLSLGTPKGFEGASNFENSKIRNTFGGNLVGRMSFPCRLLLCKAFRIPLHDFSKALSRLFWVLAHEWLCICTIFSFALDNIGLMVARMCTRAVEDFEGLQIVINDGYNNHFSSRFFLILYFPPSSSSKSPGSACCFKMSRKYLFPFMLFALVAFLVAVINHTMIVRRVGVISTKNGGKKKRVSTSRDFLPSKKHQKISSDQAKVSFGPSLASSVHSRTSLGRETVREPPRASVEESSALLVKPSASVVPPPRVLGSTSPLRIEEVVDLDSTEEDAIPATNLARGGGEEAPA
ncbi:uncharacterized protein G2W53_014620 [Senna tora]|uniref:Transmembrane protein n=1 Tax=Senna tora TaxID=362788 RepID=A0A834WTZ7_9FABA|nr:uncharacterized protein G2W53_014620 [Senna tora]